MENHPEKKFDEEIKMKNLRERKEQNLQILQRRLHDLEIEKQKRDRTKSRRLD
jgi:hypothetical protein